MRIAMKSILTGNITTRHIPVTHGQIMRWREYGSIQKAMPHVDAEDREFLISGITPEEWDKYFGQG
tara:strand:- start:304 stop:501 length:198 start_codon:yes stop_codon:yes gene_type:complete